MMEFLRFTFDDIGHFIGVLLLIYFICEGLATIISALKKK